MKKSGFDKSKVKNRLQRFLLTAVIVVCSLFVPSSKVCGAQEELPGRVLFISSYSYAWDTVQMQIEGIKNAMPVGIVLDYEFMDTKRVDDETAQQLFYEGLKYRLSQLDPYDVIILGDDAALRFALEHQDELFAGIPLVFEGVNDEELAREAAEDPLITGVVESLSVEANIRLGQKLNPNALHVIAILDDSITGQAERANFYSCRDLFPELDFDEINASELSHEGIKKQLWRVSSKYSILIYISMTEDADGKKYSSDEATELIVENAPVPVLRMVEAGIGAGLLGGNVVSMERSGETAAQMALDIIRGKAVDEIEMIYESPNIYCIDQNVMKKYNLSMSALPSDTVLLNATQSFFTRNREVLLPGLILIGAFIVIISIMVLDNLRGRKLRKELEEAKNIMESASQHDFLTGLPNRSKFMDDLQETIDSKTPCTVIMLDIDDFKKINDNYGHTAGDEALKQVAARLKDMTSPILSAYRFAGDEFILIQQSSQRKIVEKTAYQCRQIFSKNFMLAGEKRKICGSIGLACYPDDTTDLEQLIVYADDAMYHVKKNGKNDFAFYQKPKEGAGEESAESPKPSAEKSQDRLEKDDAKPSEETSSEA